MRVTILTILTDQTKPILIKISPDLTNNQLDQTLDFIKKALVLDPDNAYFLDTLGWVKYKKYLEDYILNSELSKAGSNPVSQQSRKMAQEIVDNGLVNVNEFWGVEVPLYFPKIYAGTTDCVGLYEDGPAIIDFKQTNKPKKTEWIQDYFLQLAAYAEAHNEVHGTKITKGVILMCSAEFKFQK